MVDGNDAQKKKCQNEAEADDSDWKTKSHYYSISLKNKAYFSVKCFVNFNKFYIHAIWARLQYND